MLFTQVSILYPGNYVQRPTSCRCTKPHIVDPYMQTAYITPAGLMTAYMSIIIPGRYPPTPTNNQIITTRPLSSRHRALVDRLGKPMRARRCRLSCIVPRYRLRAGRGLRPWLPPAARWPTDPLGLTWISWISLVTSWVLLVKLVTL